MMIAKTLPKAMLDDVTEREAETGAHLVGASITAKDAVTLVERSKKVMGVVTLSPGKRWHFLLDRDNAIDRLKRLNPDTRVHCDLDSDGWCWIGDHS